MIKIRKQKELARHDGSSVHEHEQVCKARMRERREEKMKQERKKEG